MSKGRELLEDRVASQSFREEGSQLSRVTGKGHGVCLLRRSYMGFPPETGTEEA